MIDPDLLKILVCPKCKTEVEIKDEKLVCQNKECGLRYPIRNGIPVMLISEAENPSPSNE